MSDYIAEARVLVLPDLSQFNRQLQQGLSQQINATNKALTTQGRTTSAAASAMGKFDKKVDVTRGKLLGLGSATARVDAALLGLRTAVGSTAVIGLGAGALAAIAFGKALRSLIGLTAAFERELNVFQATTGASASEMERVAAAAKELGADITLPAVSAADAAVAMSELAKAGLSVQDAIDGARGILQLATAANIGFADAVELAASALNAFELTGRDAVKVADTLANAANAAQGSIVDIGLSLQQAAAVGRQAGISFQDTTTFLTLLARAGLKGSDAGTSLRTALIRLINPTTKAAKIIEELGIQIRDGAGNIRPDVFLQFSNALSDLSPAARDAKLAIIGGQDALRAFAILGRTSTKDFIALRAELRQQGTAADVAAARTKGLSGAYQALQSTLETTGISIGQKISPALTDLLNNMTASIGVVSQFTSSFAGIVGAIGLPELIAAFAVFKLGPSIFFSLNAALASSIITLRAFRVEMLLALATSPAALTVGIAALAGGLIYLATQESSVSQATRRLTEITQDLVRAQDSAKTAAEGLASAQRTSDVARLVIEQARLAKQTAAVALANSTAAAGSRERAGLEINLAVATQNVTFAMEDATQAAKDLADAQAQNEATTLAAKAAIDQEIAALETLALVTELNQGRFTRPEETGFPLTDLVFKLTDATGITDTTQALDVFNAKIAETAEIYKVSGDAALVFRGRSLDAIIALQEALGKKLTPLQWRTILAQDDLKGVVSAGVQILRSIGPEGKKIAAEFVRNFLNGLTTAFARIESSVTGALEGLITALENAGAEGGRKAGEAATAAFTLSFDAEQAVAKASGASDAKLLALAQARLAKSKAFFERIKGEVASGKRPKDDPLLVAAAEEVNRRQAAVDALTGSIESASSEQQSKIEDAVNARDTAAQALFELLTGSGKRIRAINRRIEQAALTPTLSDDIKFTKQLVAWLKAIKQTLVKRLREVGASTKVIKQLQRAVIDLIDDANNDLAKLQQQQKENVQNALMQKLDLKIQFFEIKGNVQGQIKAHRAKLALIRAELKKLAHDKKKNTIAWLELKVAEAEEQKAINELTAQTKEKNNAQGKLAFAFLQAQQGFAANLLGNLIPGGATAGLVGNNATTLKTLTTAASAGIGAANPPLPAGVLRGDSGGPPFAPGTRASEQAQIRAGVGLGPTRVQGSTQIELLRKILHTLQAMNRGTSTPEANHQRAASRASLDYSASGGGGSLASA